MELDKSQTSKLRAQLSKIFWPLDSWLIKTVEERKVSDIPETLFFSEMLYDFSKSRGVDLEIILDLARDLEVSASVVSSEVGKEYDYNSDIYKKVNRVIDIKFEIADLFGLTDEI